MKKISILGATGSIGTSTLGVIKENLDKYAIHGLVAGKNYLKMFEIVKEFKVDRVAMADKDAADKLKALCKEHNVKTEILAGDEGILDICKDKVSDQVVAAIVGAAGLKPTLEAVKTGCEIGLANKEALVMTGRIFFDYVKEYKAKVFPIDSEHSAIFQSLPEAEQHTLGSCDLKGLGVKKILLTGSGGPFRNLPLEKLVSVTPKEAVAHPVWSMGPKISVDSSTMMNKGLEFIEARYLFNAKDDEIEVIIHPQSVIHSMVSYIDGAVIAQMGLPDMKTPIARSLAYPHRVVSGASELDFTAMQDLTFAKPDFERYPCLKLAMEASLSGQSATTALNASNEVCVQSFLESKIKYTDIAKICRIVVEKFAHETTKDLEDILEIDVKARDYARDLIKKIFS